jgi:hypothetical protein
MCRFVDFFNVLHGMNALRTHVQFMHTAIEQCGPVWSGVPGANNTNIFAHSTLHI